METVKFYAVLVLIGGSLIAAYKALKNAVKTITGTESALLTGIAGPLEAMADHLKNMVEGIGYCSTKLNFLERRMAVITSTL